MGKLRGGGLRVGLVLQEVPGQERGEERERGSGQAVSVAGEHREARVGEGPVQRLRGVEAEEGVLVQCRDEGGGGDVGERLPEPGGRLGQGLDEGLQRLQEPFRLVVAGPEVLGAFSTPGAGGDNPGPNAASPEPGPSTAPGLDGVPEPGDLVRG